ncbi:MAG: flagellar biosynthesis repressor FlbT [Hyphomicrobiales bacterium]|nr:flagellar biosynthesis repressor FlbT [Hyphomicrobiales bacterium]
MALVIDLKPGERLIIGEALITNDGSRAKLSVQGDAPILREKDIVRPEDADTPCKQLYLSIQLMYVTGDPARVQDTYFAIARQIQEAAPSTAPLILAINEKIIDGAYFKALKEAKKLIHHEAKLISHV